MVVLRCELSQTQLNDWQDVQPNPKTYNRHSISISIIGEAESAACTHRRIVTIRRFLYEFPLPTYVLTMAIINRTKYAPAI